MLTTEWGEEEFWEAAAAEEYSSVPVAPAPVSLDAFAGPSTFAA